MSRPVAVFDTTLRDGEQSPGCSMTLAEKLDVARHLEALGVDVIEAGFAIASKGDFESVRQVAVRDQELHGGLPRPLPAQRHRDGLGGRPRVAPAEDTHLHRHFRHPHEAQTAQEPGGGTGDRRTIGPTGPQALPGSGVLGRGRDQDRSGVPLPCFRNGHQGRGHGPQCPGHGRLHDAGRVRQAHRLRSGERRRHRPGRGLRPLSQRPGHGRGQHAGRRPGRGGSDRMHGQRHRRTGRQRRPRRGGHGPADPPGRLRLRGSASTPNRSTAPAAWSPR